MSRAKYTQIYRTPMTYSGYIYANQQVEKPLDYQVLIIDQVLGPIDNFELYKKNIFTFLRVLQTGMHYCNANW